jgi:uroporphyrinogen decarboxylase
MTSKERVLAAIAHRTPDRVPIDLGFTGDCKQKILDYLKIDEARFAELCGQDFWFIGPTYKNPASAQNYADPTKSVGKNGELYDIWGVPFRHVQTQFQGYVELLGKPPLASFDSLAQLDEYPWPKVDEWDFSGIERECDLRQDWATLGHSRGFFEIAHFMRGMDNFLADCAADPDFANALMDRIADFLLAKTRKILEAAKGKIVVFEYNDDVASQQNLFMSPSMWRDLIKEREKKFYDCIRSFGAKVRYHCCGSAYPILPDLIEIGLDILNPVQPNAANMDPYRLKREFGDRLTFHGGIDTQGLLPKGSVKEVFQETRRMIDEVGKNGGYILGTGHIIQGDVPLDNIFAIIEAATGEKI